MREMVAARLCFDEKKTAGFRRPFKVRRNKLGYCAALRGTDRGVRAAFTLDNASNMAWNGGRLM